jgi:hypothetical protein
MDPQLERAINDGNEEYMARRKADEANLKKWVDTTLLGRIKESSARGYRHEIIKRTSLPMPPLHYENNQRLGHVYNCIATAFPDLKLKMVSGASVGVADYLEIRW